MNKKPNTNERINALVEAKQKRLQLLAAAIHECNAYTLRNTGRVIAGQIQMGVIAGWIRRYLGHGTKSAEIEVGRQLHLKFLEYLYARPFTSSAQLTEHEAWGMIKWARPARITEYSPWTVDKVVRETCEAFEIEILGQTVLPNIKGQ